MKKPCSALFPVLALALIPFAAAFAQDLGSLDFANSGAAAAQKPFLRGVLLLHSFEYDDAAEAFREARRADPDFALAYWGEALTFYRPVWAREELAKGREALDKGRKTRPADAREQGYWDAVETLFGEGGREERWRRYAEAMEQLAAAYRQDPEAAAFHAVSLFGTTDGERDFRTYMKIASIAEELYAANPTHPGALHYLIHAYDDPVHAPLGLRAARRYAKVAPSAPHAQHMPSHIFLALGMWAECVSSNIDSWNSSEARVMRRGLGSEQRGYHALWWLLYGYLQQGKFGAAREQLEIAAADAAREDAPQARNHYAYMRAHYLVETREWDADLPVRGGAPSPAAYGANAFAEGRRALHSGDRGKAREWLAKLRKKADAAGESAPSLPVAALELEALLLLDAGKGGEAVEKLRQATKLEEQIAFRGGPPLPVKPSHELLGETLLQLGRPREAVRAFKVSLDRTPRRALSFLGLERAAQAAGQEDAAAWAKAELRGYAARP